MSTTFSTTSESLTQINGQAKNRLHADDRAAHDWYRFVLSFPPHLVREYVQRFGLDRGDTVLDPFCGTGTTLVECKRLGIRSIGIEANPMACFASEVKTDWSTDPEGLWKHARSVASSVADRLEAGGITDSDDSPLFGRNRKTELRTLSAEKTKLLLRNSISPLPLHKVLVLLEEIERRDDIGYTRHERLAVARALVGGISNLHFGPEVGVGRAKRDAAVVPLWLQAVRLVCNDLRALTANGSGESRLIPGDARCITKALKPGTVSAVITSPPYPNEKDYTRTTRLESVLLGFIRNKQELRSLKDSLIRSNTRGVYKGDNDDQLVEGFESIQRIAEAIEKRRVQLKKTSGFERLYPRVTRLYFGGMMRHLAELRTLLCKGANLAYVVGDQASYLRVMIRTGEILADIATSLGYEVVGIDLFRTRLATATKEQLREEVVVLRWPG